MALIKSWEVLPHLSVNNGIEYLKEIQFEESASDPTDDDLVDGRLYHQTGVGLRIYEAGSWSTLGSSADVDIPFVITAVNGGSADVTVIATTSFKMRILDAWSISSKASNSGTWKLTDGTNDIISTVSYGTSDNDVARADSVDATYYDVASAGTLHLINSESTDTSVVHILAVRVD